MRSILLLTFLIAFSLSVFGQTLKGTLKNIDGHQHVKNEIGIAISPVYFITEKVVTFSVHIHYIRIIPKTKLGIGASFERIVFDPKHSTIGIVLAYYPVEKLSFTISPGLTFEDADPGALFALHLETAYEFEIGNFHIGPAFEFAYDPNDYHISLGVHVG